MGTPSQFFGSNKIAMPNPSDPTPVAPLPVYIDGTNVVSAWALSAEERAEVDRTGLVYAVVRSGLSIIPLMIGSETEARRLVADDITPETRPWARDLSNPPPPRLAIRFSIPKRVIAMAHATGGEIVMEVEDGGAKIMAHCQTAKDDGKHPNALDTFAELDGARLRIAELERALELVRTAPVDSPVAEPKRYDFELIERDDGMQQFVALPTYERNNESIFLRLMLVAGHDVTEATVASWSDEQALEADIWAVSLHLNASDNDDVFVPDRPEHVRHAGQRAEETHAQYIEHLRQRHIEFMGGEGDQVLD